MDSLKYFVDKFSLDIESESPINIEKINRPIMAKCLYELGYKIGAEIGVAAGDHSKILLENNPDLTLYCIDPWKRVDGFRSYRDATLEEWRINAEKILKPYKNRCHFMQTTSMNAVTRFKDHSLDFVYIDGAHDFKKIAMDICEWLKKVKPGGILYGHDFTRIPGGKYPCHVKDVVTAFANAKEIKTWFTLGMEGKADGLYRESQLAWMYLL